MAGFAEELKRIPMSQGLGATLARAADYAQAQQHGEVALEHLLLALTEDDDAAQVLEASHVDMALLKADVSLYLGGLSGAGDAAHVSLAPDLKRILEAAAAAASQGRRREINGAIVLAAIVGDGRSSAAHMLRAQGLTFEEAIKALQRALAATVQPVKSEIGKADAEDIIATARARVQTRATPGLPPVALRPDPIVVPVVPPKIELVVAATKLSPVVELPLTATAWPPEVRSSEIAEKQSGTVADLDAVQSEIEAARYREAEGHQRLVPAYDRPSFGQAYEDAPDPGISEFAEADRFIATAHAAPQLPMSLPPMLPPMAAIPPPALSRYAQHHQPQPGSRWPAAVSPAWKDQQDSAHRVEEGAHAAGPPPLPPVGPDWEQSSDAVQTYDSQPGWPGPDLHVGEAVNAHGYRSVGDHFPPPSPPLASWSNDSTHESGDERLLSRGHASEPTNYDPSWPHQEPSPHWGEAGNGAGHYAEAGSPPQILVGVAATEGGGQTAPRGRRRKSADQASAGQMGESIPRKMRAHVASAIEVALTKGEFLALLDGLRENATYPSEASCVSVKLRAADGCFTIDSVSPETQWAEGEAGSSTSDCVSWRWMVTPLKPGEQRLHLVITARVPTGSGPAAVTALPEQIINVRVGSNYARRLAKLAGWVAVAVAGGLFATYGTPLVVPGIEELMKALK